MLKINIPFSITGNTLVSLPTEYKLRAGNKNYFYINVDCSGYWCEVSNLKAIFKRDSLVIQRDLIRNDTNFECQIPNEMMEEHGIFTVGIGGGEALSTNEVYVRVNVGCDYNCGESDEPDQPSDPSTPSKTNAILGNATIGLLVLGNGE